MAMGRGTGMMSVFVALLLINWSTDTTASHIPYPRTHDVGDEEGWGLGVSYQDWTNGKLFYAGDTLGLTAYPRTSKHNTGIYKRPIDPILRNTHWAEAALNHHHQRLFQATVGIMTQFAVAVFKYEPGHQNVVPVNGASYTSCRPSASAASKTQSTGDDKFKLTMGANYFICSLPGHCRAGMKLLVNAD